MTLIDAEELIGTIRYDFNDLADSWIVASERIIDIIREQKEIETEPKKGHWIDKGIFANYHGGHIYQCSQCGCRIVEREPDDFCKYCGSDNRGGENEGFR